MNKLSKYKTTVTCTNGMVSVVYHQTLIVHADGRGNVTLDSGGWRTVTTKRKMCQAANQFGLGFSVYQHKGEWLVSVPGDDVLPFRDGMTFNPAAMRRLANAA
jgi:hypothetical protein